MPNQTTFGVIANAVTFQDDGKIIVAGYTSTLDFAVARIFRDGTLDKSFAGTGVAKKTIGSGQDIARSVAVQSDGKILVAGYSDSKYLGFNNPDFALVRYKSDGSLDTSFGSSGVVKTAIGNYDGAGDYAYSVTYDNAGNIFVAGTYDSKDGDDKKDTVVVKYNSNGLIDSNFGVDGMSKVEMQADRATARKVEILSDSSIIVGGGTSGLSSNVSTGKVSLSGAYNIYKLTPAGALDTSFGSNGFINSSSQSGNSFCLDDQDRIIVVGGKSISDYNSQPTIFQQITRFNSDGAIDNSFGNSGSVNIAVGGQGLFSVKCLSDGRIIFGGVAPESGSLSSATAASGTGDFLIGCVLADGTLDSSFGVNGISTFDFDNSQDFLFDLAVSNDGVIAAAGFMSKEGKTDLALALIGTSGSDNLNGTNKIDKIFGYDGNDEIIGSAGSDYIDGGDGEDTVNYSDEIKVLDITLSESGSSTVLINKKSDDILLNIENIIGSKGNDSITGNSQDNLLIGGGGVDLLTGGSGDDIVDGGMGNDVIVGGNGAGDDFYEGGIGIDTIKYTSAASAIIVDLRPDQSGYGYASSIGGGNLSEIGDDIISGIENIISGDFNDYLYGNESINNIIAGSGDDTVVGGNLSDTLDGGSGSDTADYSDKTGVVIIKLIAGKSVSASISGKTEDKLINFENLTGGSNSDILTGDINANILKGLGGNDKLDGGAGADSLIGGDGNDIYIVDNVNDTITEQDNQGTDFVQASVTFTLSNYVENLTLTGKGAVNGTGNEQNNTITGNTAANILNGGLGNDTLDGGAGNDTLNGGDGSDILIGGLGNDILTGGIGADSFKFTSALKSNLDRITDFSRGTDKLLLDDLIFAKLTAGELNANNFASTSETAGALDYLVAKSVGSDTALFYDADGSGKGTAIQFATLVGVTDLAASDFWII